MSAIRCKVCKNFEDIKCIVKNIKVAPNKSRRCQDYDYDISKVKVKQKLKSTYVPMHMRSKKAHKKYVAEQEVLKEDQFNYASETKKDCLANFRSTASDA